MQISFILSSTRGTVLGTYNTSIKFTVPLSLGVTKSKAYKVEDDIKEQAGWKGTPAHWRVSEGGVSHPYPAVATPLLPEGALHKH